MGFYNDVVLPRLCHFSLGSRHLVPYRKRAVASAEGRVLEIGIGSGLNLRFYPAGVHQIVGLEPSPGLLAMARRAASKSETPVTFVEGSAEAIPLESESIDTVVTTWTLCSIPQPSLALGEVRRVLKPGGRLLFLEHGLAPDEGVRKWQDWLTPAWSRLSGGCHPNRPIQTLIEAAGFRLDRLETGYMPGLKLLAFHYEGSARR